MYTIQIINYIDNFMEMENQNWPPSERKNIDLSGALDDVIEQRRAGVYQKIEEVKKYLLRRKKFIF